MAATKKKRSKPRTKVLSAAAREAREKAIVADLKSGELSYRQIAQKHGVSLPTVNNKARKFGISRGRRPGAKILVPAIRRSSKKTGKTASRTVRKAVKKVGRPGRKPGRPRKSASAGVNGAGFASAFRNLLLEYYPNISLKKFEKLNEVMTRELD